MQFTLHYRGDLKANRGATEKHSLRGHFHCQLQELWAYLPLSECKQFLDPESSATNVRKIGDQSFIPLVTEKNRTMARVSVTMLRPGVPGEIFHSGGDIDNRLKTLLDGLRMPRTVNEIPFNEMHAQAGPMYCLLEDDKLIESVSVRTDRLLDASATQSEIVALIHVVTRSSGSSQLWQELSG